MIPVFLSLWLPCLPTDRIRRASPGPEVATGLVTAGRRRGAQVVAAVDRQAERGGVRPGTTLADARAVHPGLRVEPADPAAELATLEAVADWCSRFTPLVALDGADGLVLDVAGVAHLFGGEAALLARVENDLAAQGFEARAALAGTAEAAWALARFGTVRRAPDRAATAFAGVMEPLPLPALRLDPATVAALAQAGLRQVGDLLRRPRAPLAARFGQALLDRLDALMGDARTPVSPRFAPPVFVAEQRFASPIARLEDVQETLLALAGRLCTAMERQAVGARRVEARLFRVDGAVKRLVVGASRPLVRAADVARLFAERLATLGEEGLDTGYGFDLVRLGVLAADPAGPRQTDWAEPEAGGDLAGLVDRLGARFGTGRVTRLGARATHIPEAAVVALPLAAGAPGPDEAPAAAEDVPARPIRLFDRPEPVEAVSSLPDGPPMRFRWRQTLHEVVAVEGPERIAPEWWRGDGGATRDYFRAEDRDGRRFWLFREGLVGSEADRPRWFVHGLFG